MAKTLRDLSDCRVFIWRRGRPKAIDTKALLGQAELPSTWTHEGKTYRWTALDGIERIVIFTEEA